MPAAHVITLGLDTNLNASIRGWFSQFNHMPPIPLTAGRVDTVAKDKSTFGHLLFLMAESSFNNFILIIHGHSDGSGLWCKLTQDQPHPHTTYADLRRIMELAAGGPELDKHDLQAMGTTTKKTHVLVDLMRKVQAKKIDCIEFRACNLGRNQASLERFRLFFGAKRLGAPNVHSFFGLVPAKADPTLLASHAREHRGHGWETYNFPSAYKSPDLVCCFQLNHESKPESGGHIVADTPQTLNQWIREFVMMEGVHTGGRMAMHGLWIADLEVKTPGQPTRYVPAHIDVGSELLGSPLAGWGGPTIRRFIPPLSDAYRSHIVYSK